MMHPLEFKQWLENCIRDAKARDFSDEEILLEFIEQTRIMLAQQMLKVAKKCRKK